MYDLQFTDTGVIAPSSAEIKEAVQQLFINAFGSAINLDDATPQGQLIIGITEIIASKNAQILYVINQFNPSNADEPWQDAIGNLYYLERKPATPTVVQCLCTGLAGTVIPGLDSTTEAAQIQSANGDIFVCVNGGTIPTGGSITLQFQSAALGPVPAPANTVNRIYRQIIGWDSVNNPTAGVIGTLKENRVEYEQRRRNSLALYATGSRESVYSKVYNVDSVNDLVVVENDTSQSQTIQGVALVRNSIYVCVNGGDNTEIAEAIRDGKSGGCATNGEVSVLLQGAQIPILFARPVSTPISVQVTIVINEDTPDNVDDIIKQAVISNFYGEDGSARVTIGQTIYASRFYCPITDLKINVVSIKISENEGDLNDFIEFNLNELPTISNDNITVIHNAKQ